MRVLVCRPETRVDDGDRSRDRNGPDARLVEVDVRAIDGVVSSIDTTRSSSAAHLHGSLAQPAKRFIEENGRSCASDRSGSSERPPRRSGEEAHRGDPRARTACSPEASTHDSGPPSARWPLPAPEGDFRPWDEIDAWAGEIVEELAAPV
jgi:hypothetical protein